MEAGFSRAVIALSGGIDSATSCALAVRALGKDNVFALVLPYGDQEIASAQEVAKMLGVGATVINIKPIIDPILPEDKIRRGNLMARARMMVLYDQAKKQNALVVGTENKTEHLLGYFTRFGDEASDVEPLRNLYKTQVYILAKYLQIPDVILSRAPTAGLWEGQTDEGEFGFTYKEADEILYQHFDEKKLTEDIIAAGFSKDIVDRVLARVQSNDFKHHLPITP